MLEKQLLRSQRIDDFKREKELIQTKIRDGAIKAMIEKEKLQKMVASIVHSPESKRAKEKLKFLNLAKSAPISDEETP